MRVTTHLRRRAAGVAGVVALSLLGLPGPAGAAVVEGDEDCVEHHDAHHSHGPAGASARGGHGLDHRQVTVAEQREIEARTDRLLQGQPRLAAAGARIPVHVHVMQARDGTGDVTDQQIRQQLDVLNETYAGAESRRASDTGFTFRLASTTRRLNDRWHRDGQSNRYRAQTRRGGARALNLWIVDLEEPKLGIASFPWDYRRRPAIDGIRVDFETLPGGALANVNLGKTGTHEAGHWFGLYHTFQGGCTRRNDQVRDTPAQASPSMGCPEGRDSCRRLPRRDPVHNYMDYSFDDCYDQFTAGQTARMQRMYAAHRR